MQIVGLCPTGEGHLSISLWPVKLSSLQRSDPHLDYLFLKGALSYWYLQSGVLETLGVDQSVSQIKEGKQNHGGFLLAAAAAAAAAPDCH